MTSFNGNPPAETGLFVSDEETHPHLQNELPYVDPATAPPAIQAAFRLNPFNRHFIEVLANADGQFPALMQLLASLYTNQTRELSTLEWAEINMRTASLLGSAVLFLENSQLALVHNMPPEKVTLLQFGQFNNTNYWSTRERVLMQYVELLIKKNTVSDEFLVTLKKIFTAREIVEVIVIVNLYSIYSQVANVGRVDFDPAVSGATLGGLTGAGSTGTSGAAGTTGATGTTEPARIDGITSTTIPTVSATNPTRPTQTEK
ncbi:hypothetical protein MMC14_009104 [Varicellaria rhodocarpa]|nr:hypothetical protein [Varicellaria rhodocarpa]